MEESTTIQGNFILAKKSIIDAFIGGKNVLAIYLGKTLVWTKETSILEQALFDEIDRPFITEDGDKYIFVDKFLGFQLIDDENNKYNTEDNLLLRLDKLGEEHSNKWLHKN